MEKKILIIGKNLSNYSFLTNEIHKRNIDIINLDNTDEAINVISSNNICMIIIDGDCSNVLFNEKLSKMKKVPIVYALCWEIVEEYKNFITVDYITKPCSEFKVKNMLDKYLKL